jgi:hypothetical protein
MTKKPEIAAANFRYTVPFHHPMHLKSRPMDLFCHPMIIFWQKMGLIPHPTGHFSDSTVWMCLGPSGLPNI